MKAPSHTVRALASVDSFRKSGKNNYALDGGLARMYDKPDLKVR